MLNKDMPGHRVFGIVKKELEAFFAQISEMQDTNSTNRTAFGSTMGH